MQANQTTGPGEEQHAAARSADVMMALAGAGGSQLASWLQGANKLVQSGGDSDSLMRLVQVRDLLGGQGWFDLVQHRMGLGAGIEMHWSRLVDAPIAVLIALLQEVTGSRTAAEMAAAYIWPGLLLAACLFLIVRMARALGGGEAAFPAAVLALAALHFVGIFAPGSFDHHNVQLALVLGMVAALINRPDATGGFVAGVFATLSLAVGMETAPVVAAAATALALWFLFKGAPERRTAAGFGFGFAGTAFAASLLTLQADAWVSVRCDAWSGAQSGTAVLTGLGLAACALVPAFSATLPRRTVALGTLGAVTLGVALMAFPACLADPYASLDPLLKRYWLDWVSEAQGVLSLLATSRGEAAGYFATPVIALLYLGWSARTHPGLRRDALILGAVIACAIAVSLWQVRGAIFSVAFAVVPLAMLIARMRARMAVGAGVVATLLLVLAWLISFNIVWNMGVTQLAGLLSPAPDPGEVRETGGCNAAADYAALSEIEPSTVLVISNLGAAVLANTDHRVLAGPYHRNVDGNLAVLRALTSEPTTALSIIEGLDVDIVASCAGNDETRSLAAAFPQSLLASLARKQLPQWLLPIETDSVSPLEFYRVDR